MILKHLKDVAQGKTDIKTSRSSRWPTVRKHFLKNHSKCAVCGGTNKLEVHHITPFHTKPDLELDETNLITLCESKSFGVVCHLWFGHLGNYKNINPNVVEDALNWSKKLFKNFDN